MAETPQALAARGHNVMVVVPRYAEYDGLTDTGIKKKLWCFGQEHEVRLGSTDNTYQRAQSMSLN